MQLALFGATGGTGRQILQQALAAGHWVTALVRDPAKLALQDAKLTVVTGNVLNAADVDKVVMGADAVIVALGSTNDNPSLVVSKGTALIVKSMQQRAVRRLIAVTSLGVGDSKDQVPLFFKALIATALRGAMNDKEEQEKVIRASGLDWTIVRPGGLTDGPATGQARFGLDSNLVAGQVSRADVAEFVLRQLQDTQFIGKTPAIT